MTCDDALVLLPAYLDDELDTADCAAVASHLSRCAECRRERETAGALQSAIAGAGLYAVPEPALERRVARAIRSESSVRMPVRQWLMAAAAVILCVTGISGVLLLSRKAGTEQRIAQDVVASHIRSLQAGHMIDVVSSDRHTVKPWFQGRLDFAPPVPDLTSLGWILTGGRLDYVNGRPVAAIVYKRGAHPINAFIWPATGVAALSGDESGQGYSVLHWTRDGMTWWLVSDLNPTDLREFARALQSK